MRHKDSPEIIRDAAIVPTDEQMKAAREWMIEREMCIGDGNPMPEDVESLAALLVIRERAARIEALEDLYNKAPLNLVQKIRDELTRLQCEAKEKPNV